MQRCLHLQEQVPVVSPVESLQLDAFRFMGFKHTHTYYNYDTYHTEMYRTIPKRPNVPKHARPVLVTQASWTRPKKSCLDLKRGSNRCPVAADPGVSSFLMPVPSDSVKCGELYYVVLSTLLSFGIRFDWQCFFRSVR